ncbi:MAG: hypothetical protein DWQ42_17880 [Planctomycetota bacterium]|nr:MAG: hypothetical protein DWQ42_17880 [Planctomycetota bacterium]
MPTSRSDGRCRRRLPRRRTRRPTEPTRSHQRPHSARRTGRAKLPLSRREPAVSRLGSGLALPFETIRCRAHRLLFRLASVAVLHCVAGVSLAIEPAPIDFAAIGTPVIHRGDEVTAYRDPAAVYHDGVMHLYFTVVQMEEEGAFWYLGHSTSRDLVHWSEPELLTPRDRELNFSSPGNLIRVGGQWRICFQSYPTPNNEVYGNETARLWIMRSNDLRKWSEPEMLAVKGPDVPRAEMGRMIDPYLIEDHGRQGRWWCFYKQNGVSISYTDDWKTWHYVGRRDSGENVCVLRQDDGYLMFHSPQNGIGVMRSDDLRRWSPQPGLITLGQKSWPWANARLTAATVLDLRDEPAVGRYVMFFHGATQAGHRMHAAHGHGTLALAWSDDLVTWDWPDKE